VHGSYDDIMSRIAEPPVWFDEHAVPRYCEFAPNKLANICAGETALVEIACQCCRRVFRVAFSKLNWPNDSIAEAIQAKNLHYGDPPNVCCMPGAAMNSVPHRVIEYWRRHDPKYVQREGALAFIKDSAAYHEWVRDPSLEIDIRPDWAQGPSS
jgi:hypothetical protein